jgi:excisionase family DNA binding protein
MIEVYISTPETARRLGTTRETVAALLHAGELYGYAQTTAISGRVHAWKIAESSIDAYVCRQQRKVAA